MKLLTGAEAELLRYLGWPRQAIAYKLVEREILSIRNVARQRLRAGFDLKSLYASILDYVTVSLDPLSEFSGELLAWDTASG